MVYRYRTARPWVVMGLACCAVGVVMMVTQGIVVMLGQLSAAATSLREADRATVATAYRITDGDPATSDNREPRLPGALVRSRSGRE
jgi:hypothetical protein